MSNFLNRSARPDDPPSETDPRRTRSPTMRDSTSADAAVPPGRVDDCSGASCGEAESFADGDSTYDYEATLERLGGDVDLFFDLVRFFLEDAAMLEARLETALEANDIRTVEITAHSLKGLCANFGARRAVAYAYAIEESARAGKLTDAPESCARFKEAVGRLTEALRRRLPPE
jgi:HPt (histidine-containing phosphotransfer) domain-containing protein